MTIRLMTAGLIFSSLTWCVLADDAADEAARSTFDAQFDDLDADDDGLLDESELQRIPSADLQALHAHGLPDSTPISRDLFVAVGVATANAAATDEPMKDDAGRDGAKTEASKTADAKLSGNPTKPDGSKPGLAGQTRSSVKKSHFVPELPAEYSASDKNGDGQIALYEWDRKKYAEFAKLDKNGDGFLTPAELLPTGSLKALYTKTTSRTPGASGGTPGTTATTLATVSIGDPDAIDKEARNTFGQMDSNKDGSIDESDWGRSQRIRPWFESVGIKVALPLNADTFVAHYRRAKETTGR